LPSRRETWARLICDTGSAGRYLLPGRDLEFLPAFDDNGELDVQDFLEKLDDRGGSVELLASAYWLSQPEVEDFIFNDLTVLLRALGHGSRSSPPIVEPTFKGRVLWQETVLGRLSGAVPRGRYLVQHVEKSADIPENRLLKLFLTRIVNISAEMARRGTGSLPLRFATIRDAATKALSNTYLQGVELEHKLGARMLNTALRHRDHRYSRLAYLAKDFDAALVRGKWAQIVELLHKGWLSPVSSDDLFELYVLILVMQALETEMGFGAPISYGLIQRGRSAVATFFDSARNMTAELYFDQVPSGIFKTASEYLKIVGAHKGVTAQERRPDILVKFTTPYGERRVLIEVKETEDYAYMRDSIYKVLAYLRDFASLWEGLVHQKPKAILVFPVGIKPDGPISDVALVSADRTTDIVFALDSAINNLVAGFSDEGTQAIA
jgi:hypothetical protein